MSLRNTRQWEDFVPTVTSNALLALMQPLIFLPPIKIPQAKATSELHLLVQLWRNVPKDISPNYPRRTCWGSGSMFATDARRRNYSMTKMESRYASLAKSVCVQDAWALNHILLRSSTRRAILLFITLKALHRRELCVPALGILRRLTKQGFWTSKN